MARNFIFGVIYPSSTGVGYEELFFDSEESASKFVEFRNLKDAEISQYDVFSSNDIDFIED